MRFVWGSVLALVVLVAVLLVRTALHTPSESSDIKPLDISVDADRAAARLAEAIRFRTVSHQSEDDFEAEAFEGFIGWLEATYADVISRVDVSRHAGYTLLLRWPGSDSTRQPVLLTAHYDVVPVIPGSEGSWAHPPYAGTIDGGIVWGRGALDDKSGVVGQMEAASRLMQRGFTPNRDVYFSFGHDEEVGGRGAAAVARHMADNGIQLEWSLDEGSFLFEGMFPGLDKPFAAINVAEKGSVTLQIIARGAGGHSSMPPKDNAVSRLAHALTALESNPLPGGLSGLSADMFDTASRHMSFAYRLPFANRWLLDGVLDGQLSELTFGNAMLRTTIAPTMLSGSVKTNVLPIEAVATVNFRVHPRDSVDDVVKHVERVVGNEHVSVHLPYGGGREASKVSDAGSDGFRIVSQAVREIYPGAAVAPGLMIAASDTRHYGKVADNAFRFNPMKVTQEDLTGFHGTNEKISVETLAQGVAAYERILELAAGR